MNANLETLDQFVKGLAGEVVAQKIVIQALIASLPDPTTFRETWETAKEQWIDATTATSEHGHCDAYHAHAVRALGEFSRLFDARTR